MKLYEYESELIEKGYKKIAGVDEAGRGPLCGPVVSACVVLPLNYQLEGLTDSKKLSGKKLRTYFEIIKKDALSYSISIIDSKTVDKINIYQAAKESMKECINKVDCDSVLIDAMPIPELKIRNESIIKGDAKSITIAAASVIAKVTRDDYMIQLGIQYPEYGFENHKGYGTKKHLEALDKHGVIDEHRRSFKPVSDRLVKQEKLF